MDKKEALNLLRQVAQMYKGTLQEHQLLQEALRLLAEEEKPAEVVEKPKK